MHFLPSVPFRGVCAARVPPTIICGRTKQKNASVLLTRQEEAMHQEKPKSLIRVSEMLICIRTLLIHLRGS